MTENRSSTRNKKERAQTPTSKRNPTVDEYPCPSIASESCRKIDWQTECRRALEDPELFWGNWARKFHWIEPWSKVFEWDGTDHRWFLGAKVNITINALDRHARSERRDRVAYIWLGEDGAERTVTYGELYQMVCRFANGLKALGVKKADRIIIYMPFTIEGIVAMLASARIGAIHSVVYAGLGHAALRDRITDAGAKIIITGDVGYRRGKTIPLKSIVDEAVRPLDFVEKIVVFSRCELKLDSEREFDFEELLSFPPECPAEAMDSEDPLFLLYTSGSTGKPKGVVHVHGGFMVGTSYFLENFFNIGERDIFWCLSDIGWIVGHSYIAYAPLCAGVTTLFREGAIDYPHHDVIGEVLERYRVTRMFTSPTVLRMCMRHGAGSLGKYDLTNLRLIVCGGEPLNPEAWRWAQRHLAGDGRWGYVVDNWWQTEIAAPVLGTPPALAMRPGKVGISLPGSIVDVVDDKGSSLPVGAKGRLVLRRPLPYMLRSIWGDHARYQNAWREIPGAYITGDIATRDEDGYISILGRSDDVISVAGHRIGTAEVENALVSHYAVSEAAAIGVLDPIKGERIKAFVQTRSGQSANDALANEIIEHVRRELGPIATPSCIEFVESLPKTRSGKILRRLLRARESREDAGDLSTMEI